MFFACLYNILVVAADGAMTVTSIIQRTTVVINATGDNLMFAAEGGYKSLKAKEDLEKNFPTIDGGTPSYRHQQVMKSGPESIGIARNGYVENIATEKLRSALHRQTTPIGTRPQRSPARTPPSPTLLPHSHDPLSAKSRCQKCFAQVIARFCYYFLPHTVLSSQPLVYDNNNIM